VPPPSSTKLLTGSPCPGSVEGGRKVAMGGVVAAKGTGRAAVKLAARDRCRCRGRWRRSTNDISVWSESQCSLCLL